MILAHVTHMEAPLLITGLVVGICIGFAIGVSVRYFFKK